MPIPMGIGIDIMMVRRLDIDWSMPDDGRVRQS
jgi:hypothetical protein